MSRYVGDRCEMRDNLHVLFLYVESERADHALHGAVVYVHDET